MPRWPATGSVGETTTLHLRYVGDPAPEGYAANYAKADPYVLTESPEDGPVTLSGTLDVSGMWIENQTTVIGMHDADALRNGLRGDKQEVGIYVTYRGGTYIVGPTDGDAGGGEWVQSFTTFTDADLTDGILDVELVVDGTADPAACADRAADVASADGCMTPTVNDRVLTDSYGTISPTGSSVELGNGAYPGWYVYRDEQRPARDRCLLRPRRLPGRADRPAARR